MSDENGFGPWRDGAATFMVALILSLAIIVIVIAVTNP